MRARCTVRNGNVTVPARRPSSVSAESRKRPQPTGALDPAADGHDEMLEWLGLDSASEFDPAAFDVDAINESLATVSAVR